MINREGDRMLLSGPITLQNVTSQLGEGLVHVRSGAVTIDLGGVTDLDSALLAAILAWIREAHRLNNPLVIENLPEGLQTLAQLYGVEQLLPVAHRN
ncbi:MAG TPA: STAS domain-containing protein [Pyrinomonadaceae bacterium]|nr:STAS domain-containing protein [Pyrinomonadaceae bacterium]